MTKLRVNNKDLGTFNNKLEITKAIINECKNNKDIKLIEVLDDENPTDDIPTTNLVDTMLRGLIMTAWSSIDEYESVLTTLDVENVGTPEIKEILNNIIDDLHMHIGSLESCLSDNPEKGE